jgi:hypothetical protein
MGWYKYRLSDGQWKAKKKLPYNLMATVHFPTRVQNESNMAIDYIFIDNQISDHEAQLLTITD